MFPVEIWEKILQNVDAISLIPLCTVNSMWNEIIKKHLQHSDAWFRQCKQDIPRKYWFMLLENSFYFVNLQKQLIDKKYNYLDYKLWMSLYKTWMKWKNVHIYNTQITEEFDPFPIHRLSERITCCCVLGELVAIGSCEGYIRIYNLRTNQLVFRFDQFEHVECIKLWIQGKKYEKIILIATSIYKTCRIWDIVSQQKLKKGSGDAICAGHKYYCIALNGNYICMHDVTTEENFSVKLFLNESTNTYSNRNYLKFLSNDMYISNMIINEQQLCVLYNNGHYCELNLEEICKNKFTLYEPQIINLGLPKNQTILRYYLYNPHVAFCITDRGLLGISVHKSKWNMYNVFPFLEGLVTTVFFYVRILIIGLDSGDICLFSLKDESALKSIDFKNCKRIHIASEPITSVNIMEILGDQRLLVTTKKTVYHIKLDRSIE